MAEDRKNEFAFPMYVLPVKDVQLMDALQAHEAMRQQLVEYCPDSMGACAFISHTWLRANAPDSTTGEKLALLKDLLTMCAAGKKDIETDEQVYIWTKKSLRIKARDLQQIEYVWMDIWSIPQAHSARSEQAAAIDSIAAYITTASFFFCLAGPWTHENGSIRDVRAWTKRGWCRLECLANALSPREKTLIVVESLSNIRTFSSNGVFWCPLYIETVGRGAFTVESDALKLGPTISSLLAAKKGSCLEKGDLLAYRILHALTHRLLEGTVAELPRVEPYEEWMKTMKFVTAKDGIRSGWTPLRFACMAGRVDIAAQLIKECPKAVHSRTRANEPSLFLQSGSSVLGHACSIGAPKAVVELLLDNGANPRKCDAMSPSTALHSSTQGGSIELFDTVLARYPEQFFCRYAGLENIMLGPAYFGHESLVRHIQKTYSEQMTAITRVVDGMGFTPLHFACLPYGSTDTGCIRAYLEYGEDPNLTGPAALQVRVITSILRFVFWVKGLPASRILEFFALLGPASRTTPLHMVSYYGKLNAVEVLLEFGADANSTKGVRRLTPLHAAAMRGHEAVVRRLLTAGADPRMRDKYGRRPSDWARKRGHSDLSQMLQIQEKSSLAPSLNDHHAAPTWNVANVPPVPPARIAPNTRR